MPKEVQKQTIKSPENQKETVKKNLSKKAAEKATEENVQAFKKQAAKNIERVRLEESKSSDSLEKGLSKLKSRNIDKVTIDQVEFLLNAFKGKKYKTTLEKMIDSVYRNSIKQEAFKVRSKMARERAARRGLKQANAVYKGKTNMQVLDDFRDRLEKM